MANSDVLVRLKAGSTADIDSATKKAGQVLFAVKPDNSEGTIYYDKTDSIRVKMASDHATTADKLSNERYIDGFSFDGQLDITHYGTCSTPAGTAAKSASLIGPSTFLLTTGALVFIKFTNANTVANPTLNVDVSGAYPIYRYGTTAAGNSAAASWQAGSTVGFIYDGSAWQMIGWLNNNDNTLTSIYCSTAAATAAKVGQCTNYALLSKSYSIITMTAANSAQSALTLNVNSKGAKTIYINGTVSSSTNYTLPAGQYLIYYDGTNYHFRTDGKIPGIALAAQQDSLGNNINDYIFSGSINGKTLTLKDADGDTKNTLTIELATQAELLKPIKTTTTASASTWNIPTGAVQVWGERFKDSSLTYTPSGGTATEVTDTGDWTIWLAGNGTSNIATLNMRIDGDFYATTFRGAVVGNVTGNASTATKWQTPRDFTIIDATSTNSGATVSVDGSANINLPLPENIKVTTLQATTINVRGGDVNFVNQGETDRFINFFYHDIGSTKSGASWRLGHKASGSGDSNYFIIQSGTSTTTATTWNDVMRLEMNSFDASFAGNIKPIVTDTKTLGTSSLKWKAVYATDFYGNATTATTWKTARNFSIIDADSTNAGVEISVNGNANVNLPLPENIKLKKLTATNGIELTGGKITLNKAPINQNLTGTNTDAVTTSPYVPMKWTFNLNLTPTTGDVITIKTPSAGHDYGVFLSTDNGTNYYPITLAGTGRLTTHYSTGAYITLMFDSSNSAASVFPLAGGASRVTVTGGTWRVINYYDSGNPGDWNLRAYNIKANDAIVANNVIIYNGDGYRHLKTGNSFDITYPVYFSTVAIANGNVGSPYLHHYAVTITTTQTRPLEKSSGNYDQQKAVFIKGTLEGNTFTPISSTPLTQTLPTSDDGYAYYYIGRMYNSATAMTFDTTARAIFMFKDGALRQITGFAQYAGKADAANITTTANAVAYYSDANGTFASKASANGVLYATSTNGSLQWGILPAAQGGTGQTSLINAANSLLNALSTGSSTPVDTDYYISQYVGGGTTTTTYHRRPMSALWAYIKSKADPVYAKPEDIINAINELDVSDSAVSGKYVSTVSETNGKISVTKENFSPSVTIGAGTSSATPTVSITVGGASSTAQSITKATTGLFGATKLSSTSSKTEEGLAATPKGVWAAIGTLDVSDSAVSGKYVSAVSEEDGAIVVTRADFNPSVTIGAGTGSAAPTVSISVGGATSTAQSLTIASTSVYGVTKLSSTQSSSVENVAATPKGVWAAINTLDYSNSAENGKYVSTVSQTDGIITVTKADFAPSITITAGTSSAAPKVNVIVNTKSGTAQEITKATTSIYGATKLSSTSSTTEEGLAATPKGVWAAIDTVKYKVTQTGNNENKEFPILLKNANNTTDETATVKFNKTTNLDTTINPSTGMISANSYQVAKKVKLEYNTSLDTLNFVFV